MADNAMTIDEFNAKVLEWSHNVRHHSRAALGLLTDSTGDLSRSLKDYIGKQSGGPAYKVKFSFDRYGVFRHYGTGRGYKREGGVLVKRLANPKKDDGVIRRHPLDWLDGNIEANINKLADLCQEYYGDSARERVLDELKNIKIVKK